jgi:hypothetical protein
MRFVKRIHRATGSLRGVVSADLDGYRAPFALDDEVDLAIAPPVTHLAEPPPQLCRKIPLHRVAEDMRQQE